MEREDKKKKIKLIIEKLYPLAISAIIVSMIMRISSGIVLKDDITVAVNAVLVVVSILIGFIGVLVGLIFTQSDNDILRIVFDDENLLKLLKKYFMSVYRTGFLLLILSIGMLFVDTIKEFIVTRFKNNNMEVKTYMIYLWIFFLMYFTLSAYRLIKIVVELIFQKNTKQNGDEKADFTELENKYRK